MLLECYLQPHTEFKIHNSKEGIYEKAILIKQGFTNYEYTIAKGHYRLWKCNWSVFYQTNDYSVLPRKYDRYDRVIGKEKRTRLISSIKINPSLNIKNIKIFVFFVTKTN
jgi:hypothetical protein